MHDSDAGVKLPNVLICRAWRRQWKLVSLFSHSRRAAEGAQSARHRRRHLQSLSGASLASFDKEQCAALRMLHLTKRVRETDQRPSLSRGGAAGEKLHELSQHLVDIHKVAQAYRHFLSLRNRAEAELDSLLYGASTASGHGFFRLRRRSATRTGRASRFFETTRPGGAVSRRAESRAHVRVVL